MTTADVSASLAGAGEAGRLVLPSYERPAVGVHPPLDFEGYRSTALRHPKQPLVLLPHRLTEVTGPLLGHELIIPTDSDLTTQYDGEPQGQRIIVTGRVLDSDGRPVPDTLIEIWQTNAGGRYRHWREHHPAPLDPNFGGLGRCLTDAGGRYRFITIQPGSYPWGNHYNAWRPAHIHFSLFGGPSPSGWSLRCTSPATRCCRLTRSSIRCPTRRPGSGWSPGSTSN